MGTMEFENTNSRVSVRGAGPLFCLNHAVDWKGRACKASHGGTKAAVFVLGLQAFEIMAIAAVGNNLITYVFNEMHFSLPKSANVVTNFVGTIFLLSLLGGFLSDSYLGSFWTIIIFGFVELSGFILLCVQAHLPQLRPTDCNMRTEGSLCEEAKGFQALIFFMGLYLVAVGSGCVKPNMLSQGGDQFAGDDPNRSRKLSSYFNAAYFSFCLGELIALTILVWVQTHSGMDVGFGVSAASMVMALVSLICGTALYRNMPPQGSIFTPIAQVFVAAITKRKQVCPSKPELLHGHKHGTANLNTSTVMGSLPHTEKFRFLDKACIKTEEGMSNKQSPWRLCTVTQVEQVKILISVIPIFACTIIFNTILAQLQTFSVQQGSTMNSQLTKNFKVPPASLQSIPYLTLIFVVPLYEAVFVPFARRISRKESGISPLQRIGVGLFVATFSMVTAALVENKRRKTAQFSHQSISIFWIAPQFLIFGLSEMFTAVGLIEFFYKQSLSGMQSFLTAMTYCSYSFGFFFSSILVSVVNKITSSKSHKGWLAENDLNKDRLDLFYWLLAALSLINFFHYIYWSRWYASDRSLDHAELSSPNGEDTKFNSFKHVGNEVI